MSTVSASGPTSSLPLPESENRAFLLKRLHSLSGVVPLGAFLVVHLWTNAQALLGREHFERAVADSNAIPFALPLEIAFIGLPLLFHAGYGIRLTLRSRVNVHRYPRAGNWGYTMQRVTGIVALLFIVWHYGQFRLQRLEGRMAETDFHGELCASLSSTQGGIPWTALAYLLGTAACVFHFSNGLYGFCSTFGLTRSPKSDRVASILFGWVGILLYALAAAIILQFATGSSLFFATPGTGWFSSTETCSEQAVAKGAPASAAAPEGAPEAVPVAPPLEPSR